MNLFENYMNNYLSEENISENKDIQKEALEYLKSITEKSDIIKRHMKSLKKTKSDLDMKFIVENICIELANLRNNLENKHPITLLKQATGVDYKHF